MVLLPAFRALHLAATVLIGGAFAFEVLIVRAEAGDATTAAVARWLQRQYVLGLIVGLVSWIGWLAAAAIEMGGQGLHADLLGVVLAQTTFGHVWLLRAAMFAVLAALMMRGWPVRGPRASIALCLAIGLVASLAWTGHALGTDSVHAWVDAMHLIAAAVWLGMLPPLLMVVGDAASRASAEAASLAAACAKAFFVPGAVAVLVLAGSGIANASWMMDSVSDLVDTSYGRVLGVKLVLVAAMLALAGANRFAIVPRLSRASDAGRSVQVLRRSVYAELLFGAAVIVVVAWLGVTPPASHERAMPPMQGM